MKTINRTFYVIAAPDHSDEPVLVAIGTKVTEKQITIIDGSIHTGFVRYTPESVGRSLFETPLAAWQNFLQRQEAALGFHRAKVERCKANIVTALRVTACACGIPGTHDRSAALGCSELMRGFNNRHED